MGNFRKMKFKQNKHLSRSSSFPVNGEIFLVWKLFRRWSVAFSSHPVLFIFYTSTNFFFVAGYVESTRTKTSFFLFKRIVRFIGPDTAFGSIEIIENNRTMFNRRNFNVTLCQLHTMFQESFLTDAESTSRNYVRVYLVVRKIRSPWYYFRPFLKWKFSDAIYVTPEQTNNGTGFPKFVGRKSNLVSLKLKRPRREKQSWRA